MSSAGLREAARDMTWLFLACAHHPWPYRSPRRVLHRLSSSCFTVWAAPRQAGR